jgi:hypothetical protein
VPFDCLPETIPPAALVLDRAAVLVEQGWCRFTPARRSRSWWHDGTHRYCAVGAILQARHELDATDTIGIWQDVRQIAAEAGYSRIDLWNDRSWTCRRVVAGLREARDRVIAADRLARSPGDGASYYYRGLGANRREVVVA